MNRRSPINRLRRLWARACPARRVRAVVGTACGMVLLCNVSLPLTAAAAAAPTAPTPSITGLGNVPTLGGEQSAVNQTVTIELSQMHAELAALQSVSQSVYGSTYNTTPPTTPPTTTPPTTVPPTTTPPTTVPPTTTPPTTVPPLTATTQSGTVSGSVYNPWATPPPLPDLPAAPATFLPYLSALTTQLDAAAAQLPVANAAAFDSATRNLNAAMGSLTPKEVNLMYWAMSQVPNWQQFPALLASASSQLAKTPGLKAADQSALTSLGLASGGGGATVGGALSPSSQSTTVVTTSNVFNPATAPTPAANGITCPPTIPYPGMPILLNALDLIKLGLSFAKELMPHELTFGTEVAGEGVTITIPDPGWDIFEGLEDVADLVSIGANLSNDLTNDCNLEAHQDLLRVLYDNLAVTQSTIILQTTVLLQEVGALTEIVNSRTTVIISDIGNLSKNLHQDVTTIVNGQSAMTSVLNEQGIQNLLAQQAAKAARELQLQIAIERDLAAPLNQNVGEFLLPSSVGGYLDAAPVGVQSIVTDLAVSMQKANETIRPDVMRLLSLADAAVVAQRYKDAYGLFKIAYHELTNFGPMDPSAFAQGAPGQLQP